jgi:ribonuclease P/MRP protein subunit POP5
MAKSKTLTLLDNTGNSPSLPTGTIRKTQHAAIAHDRSQILLSAKRQRLLRRKTASTSSILPSVPTPALVEAAVAVATEEEKTEVEEKLRKSEEEIMGIEA